MNKLVNLLSHYGDIIAAPCFLLLSIYFYNMKNKSLLEYFFLFFTTIGFLVDLTFSFFFLKKVINK